MSRRTLKADPDEVFALPLPDRWVVFAPGTWSVAVVNHAALGDIAECLEPGHQAPSLAALDLWQALTIPGPHSRPPRVDGSAKLVIMPTRACNIRCVHCDFGAADAPLAVLDPRVAYPLVDRVAAELARGAERTMHVHFFGGEPLVGLRAVRAIVAYVRRACASAGLVARFELTTNGVCSAEAAAFLGEEIDAVVVSLDGDAAHHDALRPHRDGRPTAAEVLETLRALARYPCELGVRSCVTNRSVDDMAAFTERLLAMVAVDVLAFEVLTETPGALQAGFRAPDPYAFALGLMQAEAVGAERGVRVVHGPSELIGPRATSCPLGTGSLMLWPDGALTACYLDPKRWRARGLELTLGRVDEAGRVRLSSARLGAIAGAISGRARCERCFCRYTCAGGCHVDQTPPGCAPEYDDRCVATRLITASRLLVSAGAGADAVAMLTRPRAAEALALHPDDRLSSWAKVV